MKKIPYKDPIQLIIGCLFFIGCIGYIYAVAQACIISLNKEPDVSQMPSFLSNLITTIGAVLATNLGATLGLPKPPEFSLSPLGFISHPIVINFQMTACYVYLLTLLAAAIVWGTKDFTQDPTKVVATIPELTKTFLGVIVGVLAITLTKK